MEGGFSNFYNYLAFVLFVIAGLTDYLDGYIARKTNTETQLGALLDLIADKLLVSLVMVWLVYMEILCFSSYSSFNHSCTRISHLYFKAICN